MAIDVEFLRKIRDHYAAHDLDEPSGFDPEGWLRERIDDTFIETLTILVLAYGSSDYHETWDVVDGAYEVIGTESPIRSPWDEPA